MLGLGLRIPEIALRGGMLTYYVSASGGSDANSGKSPAKPWQTLANLTTLTSGVPVLILLKAGDTFSTVNANGAVGQLYQSNVTISSYGSGAKPIISTISADYGIWFFDVSNITIQNLNFVGPSTGSASGDTAIIGQVTVNNTTQKNWTVSNCTVSGWDSGILLEDSSATGAIVNGITVTGCTVATGYSGGIVTASGSGADQNLLNVAILNCVVTNIQTSGIAPDNVTGFLVSGCVASGCGAQGGTNIEVYSSKNGTVQFCEAYGGVSTAAADGGGGIDIDANCQNVTVQFCYVHGNAGPGIYFYLNLGTGTGLVCRFNISQNNGTNTNGTAQFCIGLATGGQTGHTIQFYGNTIYNAAGKSCFGFNSGSGSISSCQVSNNIFYSAAAKIINTALPTGTVTMQGNDYYSTGAFSLTWGGTTYSSFAAWQTASAQEKVSGVNVGLTSNPTLANPGNAGTVSTGGAVTQASLAAALAAYYELAHTSPMFDTGLNLSSDFGINPGTQDFFGNAIAASTLSVGAHCPVSAP